MGSIGARTTRLRRTGDGDDGEGHPRPCPDRRQPGGREHYQQALDAYLRYAGQPMKHLSRALADSPDFVWPIF
jgi:hypothetical protein